MNIIFKFGAFSSSFRLESDRDLGTIVTFGSLSLLIYFD